MVALDAIVACLEERRPLDGVLERDRRYPALAPRDRALVRTVCLEACRRRGQVDDLIAACVARPLPQGARTARAILRLGIVQLLFLGFAPHAAVDTSVRLAKARIPGIAPLVNAVLRRLQRDGVALVARQDAVLLNTPGWLFDSWTEAWGDARDLAESHMTRAALDLTVKDDAEGWARRLGGRVLATGSVRVPAPAAVSDLAGYACGRWWVQDAASALPVRLLGAVGGSDVLDLCAAPGGKTAQLAAAGARVTAVDVSGRRMERLRANMTRLGLSVRTVVGDAARWRPASPFDAVLLDAPCSATGTLRRHPDILWTRTSGDPGRLAALQRRMIGNALACLAPGGVLVYCVCSLQPEEGEEHLVRLPAGCRLDPIRPDEVPGLAAAVTAQGCLRILPTFMGREGGLDGFFAMRLRPCGEADTSGS